MRRAPFVLGFALLVALAEPAAAKGLPELEISGDGIHGKVIITASEIAHSVHGWIMGGDQPRRPAVLIGPTYAIDVYTAVYQTSGEPWRRQAGHVRWTYYLKSGGAVAENGSWVPFSPAMQNLVHRKIAASTGRVRASRLALLLAAIVLLTAAIMMNAWFVPKQRRAANRSSGQRVNMRGSHVGV